MKILTAHLTHVRNHTKTEFTFGRRMNVFLGENGMGKTNALEALSFLCLTKSFYAGADTAVVHRGEQYFTVDGSLESDGEKTFAVHVAYDSQTQGKTFTINNARVEKFSSVIGMFPVVILSPENSSITSGSPADRRRFVDMVISQSSRMYVEDMLEYKRIVRQRNKMLADAQGKMDSAALEPWNEMLVSYGSRVVAKRIQFVQEFLPYILKTYEQIVDGREVPKIEYAPSITTENGVSIEDIRRELSKKLERKKKDEERFQTTLAGPHRDEFIFSLSGMALKQYASQGQHKTFLIALKVAEFFYLKERCHETPVFLLDDVFGELDEQRSKKLLSLAEELGQTFITTTSEKVFGASVAWNKDRCKFLIRNGAVVKEKLAA